MCNIRYVQENLYCSAMIYQQHINIPHFISFSLSLLSSLFSLLSSLFLRYCMYVGASSIETPLGNLKVDTSLREQLLSTNKFSVMEQDVDEEEHSGEMQYPFIAKIVNDVIIERQQEQKGNSEEEGQQSSSCSSNTISGIKILPIMVGAVNGGKEEIFGRLLLPYLSDRGVFTVISSDFCHCKFPLFVL